MRKLLALVSMLAAANARATTIQSQDLPASLVLTGTFTAAGFQAGANGYALPDGTKLTSTSSFVSSQSTYPVGGDLSGSGSNPTVAKVNGVTFTGVPTIGQAPIATSATNATWQNIAGGSGLPTTGGTMTGAIQMANLQKVQFSTSTTATVDNATIGFSTQPFGRLEVGLPDTGVGSGVLQLTSPSEGVIIILSTQTVPDLSDLAIIAFSTTNGMELSSGNNGGGVELNDDSAILRTNSSVVEATALKLDLSAPEIYLNPLSGRLYIDASNFTSTGTGTHIGESASGYIDLSGNQATLAVESGTTKFTANTSSANITASDVSVNGNVIFFSNTFDLTNITNLKFGGATNRTLCVNSSGNIFAIIGACP